MSTIYPLGLTKAELIREMCAVPDDAPVYIWVRRNSDPVPGIPAPAVAIYTANGCEPGGAF